MYICLGLFVVLVVLLVCYMMGCFGCGCDRGAGDYDQSDEDEVKTR